MTEKMTMDPKIETLSHGQPSQPIRMNTMADCVYVLLGMILYIASIAIVAMFVSNVHQVNDLSVLRENLRNNSVVEDIKHIVQMVLSDMGMMERTRLDDVCNTEELPLPDNRNLGKDGVLGENGKIGIKDGDLFKLHKHRKRNSRSTISNRKRKKRRNGRPLRLW